MKRPALIRTALLALAFAAGCGDDPPPSPGAPQAQIEPQALSFGEVQAGTSKDLTFQVANTGGGVLEGDFQSGTCDAPSVRDSPACWSVVGEASFRLAAGQSQIITVRFAPYAVSAGGAQCGMGPAHCQFESPFGIVHCTGTGVP
jgi:hypothetical protein